MTTRVGLMGFGRIGRDLFRLLYDHEHIRVAAVNDIADHKGLEYLLRFDTIQGRFPTAVSGGLGATMPSGAAGQSLGLEVLLTAMLMFVIVSVATDARAVGEMAAVAIGGTVLLGAMWAGPISGASMNPARSLGPALAAGAWTHHWLYWLGPIAGAVIGAWAYELLRERPSGA